MPKVNQLGIAPIILIIILTVIIAGISGVVYQSTKEIRVRSDKTSEVVESKTSPSSSTKSPDSAKDEIGQLADKPVEIKADNSPSSPKFSITPPSGWEKLAPEGNILVEFLSPSKDEITEGVASFNVQPNITVFVGKKDFKNLDEAIEALNKEGDSLGYKTTLRQKNKINGEEVYITESTIDLAEMARQVLEAQVKEEIAKSGTKVSESVIQKDINKVLLKAKGRALTYIFYKNGYYINVTGKALESFWDKRAGQLKQSMDTFKFE